MSITPEREWSAMMRNRTSSAWASAAVALRAAATRAVDPPVPGVVLAGATLAAFGRQAGDLRPQPDGLVGGLVDGRPETVGVEPVRSIALASRDELPGMRDRTFL